MNTVAQRLTLAVRIVFGSASFAWLLTTVTLVKCGSAQTDMPAPAISQPAVDPDAAQLDIQLADDPSQGGTRGDSTDTGDDQEQPPVTDLETGLPLRVFLTPFLWGRFSLLSLTSYEGYNSNPEFQRAPIGAWVTAISTLALYSSQFSGWRLNLQYQPFLWISSTRTLKDFAATSGDIRTLRHLNETWHWTLGDRVRYSPTHSAEESKGFISDPGGGFTIGNAFLSSGRNVLVNGLSATLTDRYNENSTLIFHANQDFTHLSSFVGSQSDSLPTQTATTVAAGFTWRNRVSTNDTLSTEYNYRHQTTSGTSVADVNSHAASVGWNHKFTRTVGASASIGPAWSTYSGREGSGTGRGRSTLHGSLSLSKEFYRGGVLLSFSRSDSFSGIISDSFHNRYDFTVHRELSAHFNCSATASYVQQQISNGRNTNGELATVEARYLLSPNWAFFTQARYLDIVGNQRILGPEKSVIVGFRWSWVPEKP